MITIDCVDCAVRPNVFVVRDGQDVAEHIADGVFVTPGIEGMWAKAFETETSCEISLIDLSGGILQPARPIDCRIQPVEETALGLVVFIDQDWAILDPTDFSEIRRWRSPSRITAVLGQRVLIVDPHNFTLVDTQTGHETTIPAPEAVGQPGYGGVSPDARYVAIEYRDPSQIMDLWLLDLNSMAWTHAPSMPVRATIKRAEPTWTADGRLAVLGWFGQSSQSRYLLVVWRPGDGNLALREITQDAWFIR